MRVFLFVVYFLVGCLLSAPYTFLANGNSENFFLTALLAPPVTFFLFMIYGGMNGRHRHWGGSAFWGFLAYFCLPILLNGASLLLQAIGYEKIGNFVFAVRYFSLIAVVMAVIVYAMIASAIAGLWHRRRGSAAPPSSPSATPGGTPRLPADSGDQLPGTGAHQFASA